MKPVARNDIELPEPPPGCTLVVARPSGCLEIYCPTLKADIGCLLLGIGLAAICAAPLLWAAAVELPWLVCPMFLLASGGLAAALFLFNELNQPTTVRLAEDRLESSTAYWCWTDRVVWQRGNIRTVLLGANLEIRGKQRATKLFPGLRKQDVRWLAEIIVQVLDLPSRAGPRGEEVAVWFNHGAHESYMQGFLHTEPGRMRLRYYLLDTPDYVFRFKGPIPGLELIGRDFTSTFPLEREDVMCSGDDDGGAVMQIMVSWWQVPLTIWSADAAALHSALARFWGARDE